MKARFLKFLGACAAALSFTMPASAFTVSLDVVGQDLQVSLIGLGADTINTYDVFISQNPALDMDVIDVEFSNALGDPLVDAISGFDLPNGLFTGPGEIEAYIVWTALSNADLALIQTDPLLLFTIHYGPLADLTNGRFEMSTANASTFGCAAPDPTGGGNPNYSVQCTPGGAVPEPGSLALAALALVGAGLAGKRRRSA